MARNDYAGVETVLKDDYLGNLLKIPQQTETRLFNGFSDVTVEGKQMYIDGIAPVDYRIDNSYNAASEGTQANYFRRKLTTDRMIIEVDYDEHWFKKTTSQNPSALITDEMMKASYRFLDSIGIASAFATVYYGEKGDTALTFANDGGITIDATGGITTDLLRKINHRFTGTEVITPTGLSNIKFVITEDEQYDMGGITQLTSWQFQAVYPQNAMAMPNESGFGRQLGMMNVTFGAQAETGAMLSSSNGTRDCIALANDAIIYGRASDGINFEIIPLKESRVSTVRLRLTMTAGAVRTNGMKVIKFQTTEKDPNVFY
jgi:hypothetical protein